MMNRSEETEFNF